MVTFFLHLYNRRQIFEFENIEDAVAYFQHDERDTAKDWAALRVFDGRQSIRHWLPSGNGVPLPSHQQMTTWWAMWPSSLQKGRWFFLKHLYWCFICGFNWVIIMFSLKQLSQGVLEVIKESTADGLSRCCSLGRSSDTALWWRE